MSKYVRMRNSIIKNLNQSDFNEFIDSTIDEINYRINELNLDFKIDKNSVIDFEISNKVDKFIQMLIDNNICKTKAESIRFLLFLYSLNGKSRVNIRTFLLNIKILGV